MLLAWKRRSIVGPEPDGQQLHFGHSTLLVLLCKDLSDIHITAIIYELSTKYLLKDWNRPVRLIPAETSIDHVQLANIGS